MNQIGRKEQNNIPKNDVAVEILHNIGNVMNSINVSCSQILHSVQKLKTKPLSKIASLLKENEQDLNRFVLQDDLGKETIAYLLKLAGDFSQRQADLERESRAIVTHLEHIKTVMNSISTRHEGVFFGADEDECEPLELLQDAIDLSLPRRDEEEIKVQKLIHPCPIVHTNRHKLLQILVNLLTNARHALITSGKSNKSITLSAVHARPTHVLFTVTDNGIGIPLETRRQIFNQGFSTRKEGKGLGLHSAANASNELGGKLWCDSKGVDQGASFFLEIPIRKNFAGGET